jgi:putative N6-adenine-specific DNA methylase
VSERVDAFVVAAPGLEHLVLAEVQRLGVRPARAVTGGVECAVTWPQLWSLHVQLRIATRVLVRIARFRADGFSTLAAGLDRIDWSRWLPASQAEVTATCDRQSALYHSGAVAERVRDASSAVIDSSTGVTSTVHVRVSRNVVTVSVDASGEPLHRRGWRNGATKAPLRPTLAAALLFASGWDRRRPLVDPLCGSGTVAVEAAQIARRMAPGLGRTFAFEGWPSFDASAFERQTSAARSEVIARCPPIVASDRDEGAVAVAVANATRADVADSLLIERRALSDMRLPDRAGWVVTNPPWGTRLQGGDLRNLFARLGRTVPASWQLAVLAPQTAPIAAIGRRLNTSVRTTSGGIPVEVRTTVDTVTA